MRVKTVCILAALCALALMRGAEAQQPSIPVIVKDRTSPYWQTVLAGARKAGQELGVAVPALGPSIETDIAGQIAILEEAVAAKPLAVVIAPTHRTALTPAIEAAARAVKVVGIDSSADTRAFASFLATDNVEAGRIAADGLAEGVRARTGRSAGAVALVAGQPGAGSQEERARGFRDRLAAQHPGLRIVADRAADGRAETGRRIAAEILAAHPDLVGIFTPSLYMTQGAAEAVAAAGAQGRVALIGFDSDEGLVAALGAGVIHGLVLQDAFRIGHDGVRTALAAARGEAVPAQVDTGVALVTRATLTTPRARALLSPGRD